MYSMFSNFLKELVPHCKSMVFGVQKVGFCVAKVWFLFFECYVVVNRSQRISWLNVNISQNIRHIIPIC